MALHKDYTFIVQIQGKLKFRGSKMEVSLYLELKVLNPYPANVENMVS
jgi:hypothetical protein